LAGRLARGKIVLNRKRLMDTTLNGRTLPARRRLDVGAYYRMAEVAFSRATIVSS
jgi:hypothetical protein